MHALDEAASFLRGERITAKSRERQRRLTVTEERDLLAYFERRDDRADIPMADIMRFALATARRQEEITRLRWDDLNRDRGTALLRDVKHPRRKVGNHKVFKVPPAAWDIIERREEVAQGPLVFPFNPKSIGAAFTRAVRVLESKTCVFTTCATRRHLVFSRRAIASKKLLSSRCTSHGRP